MKRPAGTFPTYRKTLKTLGGKKRPARFIPGKDRRSGFYGRFSGPQAERKFLDTSLNTIGSITTGQEKLLCTIVPQGNTESERIGRKIRVKKMSIKGILTLAAATAEANSSAAVKLMMVMDTQTNGSAFAATDLLETDAFSSFNNLANSSRFRVLKSKTMIFKCGGGAPTGAAFAFSEDVKAFNWNIKCDDIIEYDNTAITGAVGTHRSNSIWFVAQATTTGIVTLGNANCRIRFTDA